MKIVILNRELHSGMQMYLALSTQFNVEVASDTLDLMYLLDTDEPDYTFLDICDENPDQPVTQEFIKQLVRKHPGNQLIGLCHHPDQDIMQKAAKLGIRKVLTTPIKNREMFSMLQAQ